MHTTPARVSATIIRLIAAALTIIPLLAIAWFAWVSSDPLPIDTWWHDHVRVTDLSRWHTLAAALHVVGGTTGIAVIGVMTALGFFVMRLRREALTVLAVLIAVPIVITTLKFLAHRPRPVDMLIDQGGASFPSGHSLAAAALTTVVCASIVVHNRSVIVKAAVICIGVVVVPTMMWSRTALHVHWLSDTVGGALLGASLGLFAASFLLPSRAIAVGNDCA